MKVDTARALLEPITSMIPREQLEQLQTAIKSAALIVAPIAYFLGLFIFHSFLYDHGIYGTQTLFRASYLITGFIFMIIAGLNVAIFAALFNRFSALVGDFARVIMRRTPEHASGVLWPHRLNQFVIYLMLLVLFEIFGPTILDIASGSDVVHVTYENTGLNPFHFFSVVCALLTLVMTMLIVASSRLTGHLRQALTVFTRVALLIGVLFVSFSYAKVLYPVLSPLVGGGLPVYARIALHNPNTIRAIDLAEIQRLILRNENSLYLEQIESDTVIEIPASQVASIQYYKKKYPSARPLD